MCTPSVNDVYGGRERCVPLSVNDVYPNRETWVPLE